ncbi:hypothetical protein [Mobilisporobacter senegalensis]|uniref:hypothetical protein n=1 Tax=Mobilisporobacter senegalensis TaxID=1329262 RepID=UPI000F48B90A|nr:hypothetical protein [Mobilisporobacter senegalensis]
MTIKDMRQMIGQNLVLKSAVVVIVIILSILYGRFFLTPGVYYNDSFLKKIVTEKEVHYKGYSIDGNINITVKGSKNKSASSEVIYDLPNNLKFHYIVNYKDPNHWESGLENIQDVNSGMIHEADYRVDSMFLTDKDGNILFDDPVTVIVNGESIYNKDYRVPLKNVVDLATYNTETIRGNYLYVFFAVIILVITGIDIKFPRFYFYQKYRWSVANPEPSEFYVAMQQIFWRAGIIGGLILLIFAVI